MAYMQLGPQDFLLVHSTDRRHHRIVSYIHHTQDEALQSFVGDHTDNLSVMLWVDASLAGDLRDSKSTSGAYLAIVGPN